MGVLDENDSVAGDELLMIDKLAPADGEEVEAWRAMVDVAEAPLDAVDVSDREELDRQIGAKVEWREARVGAEAWHREVVAIVGVGGSEDLRERNDAVVLAVLIVIVVPSLLGVVLERLLL